MKLELAWPTAEKVFQRLKEKECTNREREEEEEEDNVTLQRKL